MHDVVVYLSSLPRIADRNRKTEVLQAFAQGAEAAGMKTLLQTRLEIVPCRLAVILGWVGTTIKGPHIELRRNVIQQQQELGRHTMAIDGSCFKFADVGNRFLRYSLDGVYYGRSNYANAGSGPDHWEDIKRSLALNLRPWRTQGDHILICLQRDGGWSMKGVDMSAWVQQTVDTIRQYTTRRIVIRPHPKAPVDLGDLLSRPDITVSTRGSTLADDLTDAWAAVFFNSSSCVAGVLAGVPIFAHDEDCVGWSVANHDLADIEDPAMPERSQWLWDLSAAHWTDEQSRQGEIIRKFQAWF